MATDDLTRERIAENQSTFRSANEKIVAAAENIGVAGVIPFICECPDPACTEIVRLGVVEYEEIRRNPRHFFSAPGHEVMPIDRGIGEVVDERSGYTLVEKIGIAGQVAEQRSER